MGTFNIPSALLGTSAPTIAVTNGLDESEIALVLRSRARKAEQAQAKATKEEIRARVRDRAIPLLLEERLVVLGQEMDGITAIQYHIAFSNLNYKAPTKMSQDVLDVTWPFLRAFQARMQGVDHFLINEAGLSALLLLGAELTNGDDESSKPVE